ncbi:DUF2278 family protein [Embleya sp. NPDC127516]|uniref:DUF2278 family protein n=1 Tax=Embleya sp. NPDC127516 TaxID=3363990 RepID=UPI00380E17DE
MPLRNYGVPAARAVARVREGATDTPHYQIHLTDDAGTAYRAAINVLSTQAPSELLRSSHAKGRRSARRPFDACSGCAVPVAASRAHAMACSLAPWDSGAEAHSCPSKAG